MIRVKNLNKRFHAGSTEVLAVNDACFEVAEGKLLSIVGPSGCGKTTTLRCVAGLEHPESGDIRINGHTVFSSTKNIFVPPHRRRIGMVFQSYAIWPHMNVFDHVAFPLKFSPQCSKKEVIGKVEQTLALVHLDKLIHRPATDLSGGQQQRLALARAIVAEPKLLLLDEPLSNLDTTLRDQMRSELKRIQQALGITTIYVTHDQGEALSLADLVGVMYNGKLIQLDLPHAIYEHPKSEFVAQFMGAANLIPGTVIMPARNGLPAVINTPAGEMLLSTLHEAGTQILIAVKPEDFEVSAQPGGVPGKEWNGEIVQTSYLGSSIDYLIGFKDVTLRVISHPSTEFRVGDSVCVKFKPGRHTIIPVRG